MKYTKTLFFALLLVASGLSAQTKKSPFPNLNGKWVSKQDPHYTLQIKNGWIMEAHLPVRQVDSFTFEISGKPCQPPKTKEKKALYLRKKEKKGNNEYCYKLLTYTSNAFSMRSADNKTYQFIRYLKRYQAP